MIVPSERTSSPSSSCATTEITAAAPSAALPSPAPPVPEPTVTVADRPSLDASTVATLSSDEDQTGVSAGLAGLPCASS